MSIDVWWARLDVEVDASMLGDDELERAERFHFADDRRRFIARRVSLRRVLAEYLGVEPASISYDVGEKGKLSVDGCEFNVSRSADLAVVAITPNRAVGVDIERLDAGHDPELLVGALSAKERELDHDESSLLRIWTRKEAVVKAIGVGLAVTPKRFSSFAVDEERIPDPRDGVDGVVTVASLDVPEGWIGAVAALGDEPLDVRIRGYIAT